LIWYILSLDEAKNAGNTVVLARLFNEVQAENMPSRMVRLILSEYLAKEKYTEINALTEHPNMLDYERGLREVMDDLARSVINEQYRRANR
jgi:hypothetical protein